jgi:hypothetical protein
MGEGFSPLPVFLPSPRRRHPIHPCLDGAGEGGVVLVGREAHGGAGEGDGGADDEKRR